MKVASHRAPPADTEDAEDAGSGARFAPGIENMVRRVLGEDRPDCQESGSPDEVLRYPSDARMRRSGVRKDRVPP